MDCFIDLAWLDVRRLIFPLGIFGCGRSLSTHGESFRPVDLTDHFDILDVFYFGVQFTPAINMLVGDLHVYEGNN